MRHAPTNSPSHDHTLRLRAGIVADRFLIKAPTLARSATPAAAEAEPLTKATDDTNGTTTDAPCLPLAGGDQSRAGSDFEAARVAARKAGENYTRAGNPGGALRARRTEVSLNGDENMATVAPLLEKRCVESVPEVVSISNSSCCRSFAARDICYSICYSRVPGLLRLDACVLPVAQSLASVIPKRYLNTTGFEIVFE